MTRWQLSLIRFKGFVDLAFLWELENELFVANRWKPQR